MRNNTGSCDKQNTSLVAHAQELDAAGVNVVAISRDKPAAHEKYAAKLGIPYTLVSDPDDTFAKEADAIVEKSMYGKKYLGPARARLPRRHHRPHHRRDRKGRLQESRQRTPHPHPKLESVFVYAPASRGSPSNVNTFYRLAYTSLQFANVIFHDSFPQRASEMSQVIIPACIAL